MKIMLANKPCIAYNNSCSIPLAGVMELVDVADSKASKSGSMKSDKNLDFQGFPDTIKYGFYSEFSPCSLL